MREASRLRATLGSEPSGGYAYHDKGRVDRVERVERVRPARIEESLAPQPLHTPRERAVARPLPGGLTLEEAGGRPALSASTLPPANDQARPSARGSWPPMPHVPSDLVGSMDYEDEPSGINLRETQPGVRARRPSPAVTPAEPAPPPPKPPSSAPTVGGGAIWQAMPSVVEQAESLGAVRVTEERVTPEPAASSRLAPFRPSLAELEAEHAGSYGDPRVLGYEALVERNDWEQIAERLAGESDLSPTLQLLKLIARRETLKGDEQRESAQLTQQAIAFVAQQLQLPEASPTALVLGKRILRRNQPWTKVDATSSGVSWAIVVTGLSVGAGIGWLITRLMF